MPCRPLLSELTWLKGHCGNGRGPELDWQSVHGYRPRFLSILHDVPTGGNCVCILFYCVNDLRRLLTIVSNVKASTQMGTKTVPLQRHPWIRTSCAGFWVRKGLADVDRSEDLVGLLRERLLSVRDLSGIDVVLAARGCEAQCFFLSV